MINEGNGPSEEDSARQAEEQVDGILGEIEHQANMDQVHQKILGIEQTLLAPDAPSLDPNAGPLRFSYFIEDSGSFDYTPGNEERFRSVLLGLSGQADVRQETMGLRPELEEVARLALQTRRTEAESQNYGIISLERRDDGTVYEVSVYAPDEVRKKPLSISIFDRTEFERIQADVHLEPANNPWRINIGFSGFDAVFESENFSAPLNDRRNPKNWTDTYIRQFVRENILPLLRARADEDKSRFTPEELAAAQQQAIDLMEQSRLSEEEAHTRHLEGEKRRAAEEERNEAIKNGNWNREYDEEIQKAAGMLVGEAMGGGGNVVWNEIQQSFTGDDWAEARRRASEILRRNAG